MKTMKFNPIIESLLDTDLYKINMGQVIKIFIHIFQKKERK